ncbi:MAG: PilX N-terminal domain-containing pilus assembly protein [Gammaproteobacteria bacterium]
MIRKSKQKGMVLIIGLIMLTVLTLLVVSSMQSSSLQTLMSNNMQDKTTAFEAAESAIRAAESFLENGGALNLGVFDDDESDGLLSNLYDEAWNAVEIDWDTDSVEVNSVVVLDPDEPDTIGGVQSNPRYIIQHFGEVNPEARLNVDNSYNANAEDALIEMFKITARGTGGSDNTVVFLEAMYGVSN